MRIKILRVIIIGFLILVTMNLVYVQVIRGKHYYRLSVNNRIRVVPLESKRGRISDRNGIILADNFHAYDITITPQDILNQDKLFTFVSQTLEVDKKILIQRYNKKRYAPFAPVTIAEDINREQAIAIEENKHQFPSLHIQESFKRIYPKGKAVSHVLGYVGKADYAHMNRQREYGYSPQSLVGKTGIEEYYDAQLRGVEGGLQVEVDSRGRQVSILSFRDSENGEDLKLTIDSAIQDIATEVMADQVGAIVMMDMDNGEILGMVSSPSYDISEPLRNAAFSPYVNRAIQGLYPPGSVFKILVAIAALNNQKITAGTTFFCPGFYELGGKQFRCSHTHDSQNLIEAITHSCNVYFFHVGLALKEAAIAQYAHLFGLGARTHIDLPFEREGLVPSRQQRLLLGRGAWYAGDTLNFSIGQGDLLVTPLQLVRMMANVARSGDQVQPHFIKSIGSTEIKRFASQRRLDIDPKIFKVINNGLRAAVTDMAGTARTLDIPHLYVAGKTGTAQSAQGKEHHAWFVGYVKGETRNIAFCVFVEHGGSSENACLIARDLLLQMKDRNLI